MSNHIKHSKAVVYNRRQFLFKTSADDFRERIAVKLLCSFPTHILKILFRTLHFRCVRALGDRTDLFDHVIYLVCVSYDNLESLFFAKIREFFKHFLGGAEIKSYVAVGVLEFERRKKDLSSDLIFLVYKVRVTGSHNRLTVLFTKLDDLTVKLAQTFVVLDASLCYKKTVIAYRLNFKIVIKVNDFLDLVIGGVFKYGVEQLTRLAGGADNKSLAMLFKLALGNSRITSEIFKVTL